jgi:hypothetical protein
MVGDVPVQVGLVHPVDRDQEHVLDVVLVLALAPPATTASEDDTANGVAIAMANAATPAVANFVLDLMLAPLCRTGSPSIRGSVRSAFERCAAIR